MPSPLLAPAIAGGAQVLGGALNAWSTGNMNRKSREFAERMYMLQRSYAQADWQMQNEYNHPAAQMRRFQEAGLNPNLIYGQQNTGAPLTSPDIQKPEFNVPRYGDAIAGGALTAIDQIYNLELKQAQVDNVEYQRAIMVQEAALKAAQVASTVVGTERKEFDLDLVRELRETSIDARKEALRQMKVSTDISMRRDVREALMTSSNLKEAQERIKSMIVERTYTKARTAHTQEDRKRVMNESARILKSIDLMFQEGAIKDLDVKLSQQNIRPGDPIWYRSLGIIVDSVFKLFD